MTFDENAQIKRIFVIFILILEKCGARMSSPVPYWDWVWKCALQSGSICIFVRFGTIAMVIAVEKKKIHWRILVDEVFLTVVRWVCSIPENQMGLEKKKKIGKWWRRMHTFKHHWPISAKQLFRSVAHYLWRWLPCKNAEDWFAS